MQVEKRKYDDNDFSESDSDLNSNSEQQTQCKKCYSKISSKENVNCKNVIAKIISDRKQKERKEHQPSPEQDRQGKILNSD